ncbi:MAG: ArsR/SmtB family transcription factor [Kiritimatiellia bacterium]
MKARSYQFAGIPESYAWRARVIKALAHPARLLMVDELQRGAKCVCDLRARVGSDISTVSKHLSVLRNAGIVRDEKRGVQVFYRLQCPCVTRFLACVENMVRTAADARARSARATTHARQIELESGRSRAAFRISK